MKPDSPKKKTEKKTARKPAAQPNRPAAASATAVSQAAPALSQRTAASRSTTSPAPASAKAAKPPVAPATVPPIPSILLEGDESSPSRPSGPGQRYDTGLSAAPPESTLRPEREELPESYGTQKIFVAARDPQWVYAHWDFSQEQLRRYNTRSVDRHLVLRVYKNEVQGAPHREIHVHPESRNWFVHVEEASTRYIGQLGYYLPGGDWVALATSAPTLTPSDAVSPDLSVWFETLPVEVRFDHLLRLVKQAVRDHVPLMEALQQMRALDIAGLPDFRSIDGTRWTPEQERALAAIVSIDSVRRVWMGSLEITELIRRQFLQELSSQAAAQLGETGSWSGAVSSLSSPYGGLERAKGFWFNVNAELIIYGATEPDATVTIGGRTIRLRPDGTFSYRFILPDGRYELPAIATSADGSDSRSAELQFSRTTRYRGEVHAHPQDPAMKAPLVEHVS